MKKILFTIALLFVAINVTNAATTTTVDVSTTSKKVLKVNAFCKLIQKGDYNAVKTLIDEGIDVNEKSMGLTPLMFAARHNKAKIAKLLIKNGAKLKVKSSKGYTALKYAKISNAKKSFKVIKEAIELKKRNKKLKKRGILV